MSNTSCRYLCGKTTRPMPAIFPLAFGLVRSSGNTSTEHPGGALIGRVPRCQHPPKILPGRWKPDVLRLGIVAVRRYVIFRVRLCMKGVHSSPYMGRAHHATKILCGCAGLDQSPFSFCVVSSREWTLTEICECLIICVG